MTALERAIGYTFSNPVLLETALTHSSHYNENRRTSPGSNERLEFLGDSVLGFVTAEYLYKKYPHKAEGELTRLRASLVCESHLAYAAAALQLSDHLLLGKGERVTGGQNRPSILSDAFEALIAALFLDGGLEAARPFVIQMVLTRLPAEQTDYKTVLQEFLQRDPDNDYSYQLVDAQGPDHAREYTIELILNGKPIGIGHGRSKKEAEQQAAKAALAVLA